MEQLVHPELIAAVKQAGDLILKYYADRKSMHLDYKTAGVLQVVTAADREAERIIFDAIRKVYPHDSIYGEEGARHSGNNSLWYIDPIDGTSNFVRGIPIFAVNVGRATGGTPDIGVIYLPIMNDLFIGVKGKGSYRNGVRMHVSKRGLSESYGFSGCLEIHDKIGALKYYQATAYELTLIANGDGEIYALSNVPYDVVPGIVLITEAGGTVTDSKGKPYKTDCEFVIATNGVVHTEVLELLHKD